MKRADSPDTVAADAIECFRCLADPDGDPRLRAKWVAWLGATPDNRAAYEAVQRAWRRPLPTGLWPTQIELEQDDYDPDIPVARYRGWRRNLTGPRVGVPLVAAILLAVVVGSYGVRLLAPGRDAAAPRSVLYRTGRGESRTVALDDGSKVLLGPLSEFETTGSRGERSGRLLDGEALFDIVHNPARPFSVSAGAGEVRDLGTEFSVALSGGSVIVTVVDGSVSVTDRPADGGAVDARTLGRGQQVTYSRDMGVVVDVDAVQATGWSRGRLAYVDRPLGEVAADLTRYSKVDVGVADSAAAALRYTGTVDTDAIGPWAASLAKVYPVVVDSAGATLTLRSAPKT